MNQKGVTLAGVVVMIIIMMIIATVSMVAGNHLIVNSKEASDKQEIESIRLAVERKKAEVNMAGTLIPIGESYVGHIDPIIKSDTSESITAEGWYLLDEVALEKLGIYDVSSRYIVNYEYGAVLTTKDSDYVEEYLVIEYMYDLIENNATAGTALKNKKTDDDNGMMVKNKDENELFGTNWYLLKNADFPAEQSKYINHSYLINFETKNYVKVTSSFEGINIEL